ncbi:MAG: hypothetical protein CSA29_05825 [Desulfobacterales bacterium]|nr:MAG: hypothetical protein CSA29_05825 [Desulfobacterales bacterium]
MKYLFILIHAVLIFWIADYGVEAVYTMFTSGGGGGPAAPVAPRTDAPPQKKASRQHHAKSFYDGVAQRALFGPEMTPVANPSKPPVEKPVEKLKETKLKLDLLGTVTGTGTSPKALIRKSGKSRVGIYAVGDKMDGARIEAVMRMRVVLMVNGKKEVLRMKKNKSPERLKPSHLSTMAPTADMLPDHPRTLKTVVLTQDEVISLKDNIRELKKQVRVRPYFLKNKMQGFRISRITSDSVFFKKLGLRNGDIISGINGQEITSFKDMAQYYDEFNNVDIGTTIDLQIKRRGKLRSLRYSIQ